MVASPLSAITRRRALQGLGTAAIALTLGGCGESDSLNFANLQNYLGETTLDDFRDAAGSMSRSASSPARMPCSPSCEAAPTCPTC